eukprot:NODE_1247_length_1814_cov_101.548196_g1182_i0.p1 GENE.NODE_1247_length_1814_cov_101.548196_g1182_i0~~NODE_1247_length_1814_cov_101.548196_g1182_i0.p1  ORF type:complete len:559 (+),score=45.97 NODE_1247_length_1814_cov_101.548196_g1182_i0:61-1737(+)
MRTVVPRPLYGWPLAVGTRCVVSEWRLTVVDLDETPQRYRVRWDSGKVETLKLPWETFQTNWDTTEEGIYYVSWKYMPYDSVWVVPGTIVWAKSHHAGIYLPGVVVDPATFPVKPAVRDGTLQLLVDLYGVNKHIQVAAANVHRFFLDNYPGPRYNSLVDKAVDGARQDMYHPGSHYMFPERRQASSSNAFDPQQGDVVMVAGRPAELLQYEGKGKAQSSSTSASPKCTIKYWTGDSRSTFTIDSTSIAPFTGFAALYINSNQDLRVEIALATYHLGREDELPGRQHEWARISVPRTRQKTNIYAECSICAVDHWNYCVKCRQCGLCQRDEPCKLRRDMSTEERDRYETQGKRERPRICGEHGPEPLHKRPRKIAPKESTMPVAMDLDSVRELDSIVIQLYRDQIGTRVATRSLLDHHPNKDPKKDFTNTRTTVLKVRTNVVCVATTRIHVLTRSSRFLEVMLCAAAPTMQRRGYGSILVKLLLHKANLAGCSMVCLKCSPKVAGFWASLGFVARKHEWQHLCATWVGASSMVVELKDKEGNAACHARVMDLSPKFCL